MNTRNKLLTTLKMLGYKIVDKHFTQDGYMYSDIIISVPENIVYISTNTDESVHILYSIDKSNTFNINEFDTIIGKLNEAQIQKYKEPKSRLSHV